jgi:hypothetical protein
MGLAGITGIKTEHRTENHRKPPCSYFLSRFSLLLHSGCARSYVSHIDRSADHHLAVSSKPLWFTPILARVKVGKLAPVPDVEERLAYFQFDMLQRRCAFQANFALAV